MTLTAVKLDVPFLTYEDYLEEPELSARYDIVDGVRVFMTQPNDGHQEISLNIAEALRDYQRRKRVGRVMIAPCDVLITQVPLRTRQPDVMFISRERYAGRSAREAKPYSPAPELVVEVLSPSDTRSVRVAKIRDFCSVDVRECWLVNTEAETVEVLRLTADGPETVAVYAMGQTLQSLTFADLEISLDSIFEIEW